MSERGVFLFELNEVPFRVLDDYAKANPASCVARLLSSSHQFETYSQDSALSPWVTWPTVHRGVTDKTHKLQNFGEDLTEADGSYPPLWSMLARAGVRTGQFASLHSYPLPGNLEPYDYYMPDTFAPESSAHPADLSIFQEFNLSMARASVRNVSTSIPVGNAFRLLRKSRSLGLRAGTLKEVAGQVLGEKFQPWKRVRRRIYQSVLAFDVFLRQFESKKPRFTTFFTNHVASSMHRYWAARYPEDYTQLKFEQDWIHRYRGEIDFAMNKFESCLRKLLKVLDSNYLVFVASSMGQAAASGEPIKSQLYLTQPARFMSALGLTSSEWSERPAMAPRISVVVQETAADRFRGGLETLTVDGTPLKYQERERGFFSLFFGQRNLKEEVQSALLAGRPIPFDQLGLEKTAIEDESGSSAYHVREGSLLVLDPRKPPSGPQRSRIDTTEIAPTILKILGVAPPPYMAAPVAKLI